MFTTFARSSFISVLVVLGIAQSQTGELVETRTGMVVSGDSIATVAGVEVLERGGNAIDAAVAVGFTLAVTHPQAGNLGGGGFMLIRLADGHATVIDFRDKAPNAATRTMFLDSIGNPIPGRSELGLLAAGVPGTVAGLLSALDSYGTMTREQLLDLPIKLAENGFPVRESFAASLAEHHYELVSFPSSRKLFTRDGVPYQPGDLLRQPDLARTLKEIRAKGTNGFYDGEIGDLIVAEMGRGGGIITEDDLLSYAPIEREPVAGTYRGLQILSAPPPSSGGITLVGMLNLLEPFDLGSMKADSSRIVHLIAAAAQRVYADRVRFGGDPDFVRVPVEELISKQYARQRQPPIDPLAAVSSENISHGRIDVEDHETTHYCVADGWGNVVGVTTTLNSLYGCKVAVDGAGFLLNNQMDDFAIKQGELNQFGLPGGEANSIAPHKRMLSSMAPTIVLKNGIPFLLLGARGGGRIITAVAQVILNVVDFGMEIQEAVDAPRIHHQWMPDTLYYEPLGLSERTLENLRAMGYNLQETPTRHARVQALMMSSAGYFRGGSDRREDGLARGN